MRDVVDLTSESDNVALRVLEEGDSVHNVVYVELSRCHRKVTSYIHRFSRESLKADGT